MKQIYLFFLMLLLVTAAAAQLENADSLENIINTQELSAEKKLELYVNLSRCYMKSDQVKFKAVVDKGLELAGKEKNEKMLSAFNTLTGIFYSHKSSYDTALVYAEQALVSAIKIKNKALEATIYTNIGLMYGAKGDIATEIEYNLKALSIYETIDDSRTFITLLINLGTTYSSLQDSERAMYYFDRANKLAEEINYAPGKLIVAYAYGNIYYEKIETEKCLEYYLKSLEISREINDKHFEALCAQSIATVYSERLRDFEKAEQYANESLLVAEEFGDPFKIRGSLRILAQIYLHKKQYKESNALAAQAWAIDSIDIDTSHGLALMMAISNIYLNNKEKAEYFLHEYVALNGEKSRKNLAETLIGLEVEYETEKKENRISSLEKEKQLYLWLALAGILLIITFGIVLWQNIRNTRRQKQLIAARSVLDGEMKERARLARDLHDRLSGNLSAVKIGFNDNNESMQNINEKLDSCVDEIRRVAHNLMPASLQYGLKTALEDFAVQFSNVHFHFFGEEKRIDERTEFVIYCCASELVNNSVKHSGAKNINMQLIQSEEYVSLTVQDNGCGFDEKYVVKGIGLKNIRDRVMSCNGKLDIITAPDNGTETIIELKINR